MKRSLVALTSAAVALGYVSPLIAQYAPPPPPQPFPGFINDFLRKRDPYYSVWDIGGAVRLRYELKENGLGLPANNDWRDTSGTTIDNDNSYFSDKILAHAGYTAKWWSIYVQGRSSSTTGDDRNPNFESDGIVDLHQAFFTLGNHKEFPVSLKLGRQELSYGDERLVGAFGWHNIGRVFDAARVRWQNAWFAAEAFTGKIVLADDNNFNTWNDYNLFSGLHVSTKKIPKTLIELYFFARNDGVGSTTAERGSFPPFQFAAPPARDIYTLGGRVKSGTNEFGGFDFTIEGAYQFGNWKPSLAGDADRQDHRAFAFMANAGYTFEEVFGKPRVALEYAYATGDGDPTDNDHDTFDNLYPTNHKFYGYMDFLSWQNLHDVRGIFQMKPHPRVSFAVEGHLFWLADTADSLYNVGGVPRAGGGVGASTGFNRNPSYDSFVGGEIDVVAGYAVNKFTALEAGYGHFFAGDYIDQSWASAGGSSDAHWFYIQTMIRF